MGIEFGRRLAMSISEVCRGFDATHQEEKFGLSGLRQFNDLILKHTNTTADLQVIVSVYSNGATRLFINKLVEGRPISDEHERTHLSIQFAPGYSNYPRISAAGNIKDWSQNPMVLALLKEADVQSNHRLRQRVFLFRDGLELVGQHERMQEFAQEVAAQIMR